MKRRKAPQQALTTRPAAAVTATTYRYDAQEECRSAQRDYQNQKNSIIGFRVILAPGQ